MASPPSVRTVRTHYCTFDPCTYDVSTYVPYVRKGEFSMAAARLDYRALLTPVSASVRTRKQWAITLAATAVSTYALDAVATAAGMLSSHRNSLRGLDHARARVSRRHLRRLGGRATREPRGELDIARGAPEPAPTRCRRPRMISSNSGPGASARGGSQPRSAMSAPSSPRRCHIMPALSAPPSSATRSPRTKR